MATAPCKGWPHDCHNGAPIWPPYKRESYDIRIRSRTAHTNTYTTPPGIKHDSRDSFPRLRSAAPAHRDPSCKTADAYEATRKRPRLLRIVFGIRTLLRAYDPRLLTHRNPRIPSSFAPSHMASPQGGGGTNDASSLNAPMASRSGDATPSLCLPTSPQPSSFAPRSGPSGAAPVAADDGPPLVEAEGVGDDERA